MNPCGQNPLVWSRQLQRIEDFGKTKGELGRYAPSTTGLAHPGTILSALLCWLDARSSGAEIELRLEDLDPDRSNAEFARGLVEDLAWFGLDWDRTFEQSSRKEAHEKALDRLAAAAQLYPCSCSRSEIRRAGQRTPDGGFRYSNRCRDRTLLPADRGGWRASAEPLRARLPEGERVPVDRGGLDLRLDPGEAFGDPIVRRRDGATAYHLASVVDDAISGVTRIVRGRDLAMSSATQMALREMLGFSNPSYRHHMLLLEETSAPPDGTRKLSKLHQAVALPELRNSYSAADLCGKLAAAIGLLDAPRRVTPNELLPEFSWERVNPRDIISHWTGSRLVFSSAPVEVERAEDE
jgi:glutamyl/glutaminyl-tRNA synthetase